MDAGVGRAVARVRRRSGLRVGGRGRGQAAAQSNRFRPTRWCRSTPGYLAGWTVERYQIDLVAAAQRSRAADGRRAARSCAAQQVPGDTYRNLVVDATFSDQTFKHILAPVWLMTYVYGATSYQVVVNGVTGTMAGSRPWSWIKIALLILAILMILVLTTTSGPARLANLFPSAISRGWRKRCPHCGEGALFAGWAGKRRRCDVCGLVFERNPGDTWAFTILGDRIPVGLMVVIVYFGVFRRYPLVGSALFIALAVAFVVTTPNRWGVGIALHYASRVLSGDVDDPTPSSGRR